MIPKFIDIGSIWKVLPPGIHEATLKEVEQRFAITDGRRTFEEYFQIDKETGSAKGIIQIRLS